MKKEIKQLNFAKGMIENIKQDLPNQVNPVFESAAWVENFNPNVQTGSLTIRAEQSALLHSIGANNILDLTQYSKLVDLSANDYNVILIAHERLREKLVVSTDYLPVGKPSLADAYVSFVRRFSYRDTNPSTGTNGSPDFSPYTDTQSEATAVVAWVPYVDANGNNVGWREPFHDNEDYPGWYTLGTYYDHARYGESVVFVTYPRLDMDEYGMPGTYTLTSEAKELHYPCYVWQWWDLSRKREGVNGDQKFWNGLDVGDITDPKYRLWKVRRPSMQIVKDNIVEAVAAWKHNPITWSKFDGTDCDGTNEAPIQLLIWESPLQTYTFQNFPKDDYDPNWYSELVELQKNDYIVTTECKSYENPFLKTKNISFIDSIETINIDGLYSARYGNGVNRREKQTGSNNGVMIGNEFVQFPYRDPKVYGGSAWSPTTNFTYVEQSVECNINGQTKSLTLMLCKTEDRGSDWSLQYNKTFADYEVEQTCNYRDPYEDPVSSTNPASGTKSNELNAHAAFGTKLPDYLTTGIPRQWIKGEQIPFILTATINGVEVVLLKDIYKVSTRNYACLPQLFSPFWWGDQTSVPINALPYARTVLAKNTVDNYSYNDPFAPQGTGVTDIDNLIPPQLSFAEYNRIVAAQISTGGHHIALPFYHGIHISILPLVEWNNNTFLKPIQRTVIIGYEPFNPTSEILYYDNIPPTVATTRFVDPENLVSRYHSVDLNYLGLNAIRPWFSNPDPYSGIVPTNPNFRRIPYFAELCEGNMVHFTMRIKSDFWPDISSQNISAFNLYVSKPNFEESILRSTGTIQINPVQPGIYNKPLVQNYNAKTSQDYALVKTWLIEGEGQPISNWENYRGTSLATNAWKKDGDWIYAVPQEQDGTARSTVPTFVDHCRTSTLSKSSSWTPDFILWDYPTQNRSIALNSSGEYYEGLGAKNIAVIKGRTFIDDPEDIGVIHYSDVQSGVVAQDIFSIERKMRVGHNRFTAFVEYREQLWFFSRYDNYRLQMPNVFDETTWEFLDNVAMGTFSKKTVAVTPYGLVYANEAGVWITDGRMPENLAVPVLPSYQYLVRYRDDASQLPQIHNETAYLGEYVDKDGVILNVVNDPESGINEYMEIVYDSLRDELNVISPLWYIYETRKYVSREFRLIYNFANKNWRVESFDIPLTTVEA